jgi:hypothetical protein
MATKIIPQSACEVLSYCPQTGDIRWLVRVNQNVRAGDIAGSFNRGYRRIRLGKSAYLAHRIAWFLHYGEQPPNVLDHINGNKADNRIANLRAVSFKSNSINRRGHHGVSWTKPKNGRKGFWATQFANRYIYHGPDLFEAWCRRKSAEAEYWANH